MKVSLLNLLVLAAAFLCTPAFADSYAFVNFDELQGDSALYPFAGFYGGVVESGGPGNNIFAACYEGFRDDPCSQSDFETIYIEPSFPVHELTFQLGTGNGYFADTFIFAEDDFGNTLYGNDIKEQGLYNIDIKSSQEIRYVYLYDDSFLASFAIDDVAFNPSFAPTAATPEPPSLLMVLSAILGSMVLWHGRPCRPDRQAVPQLS